MLRGGRLAWRAAVASHRGGMVRPAVTLGTAVVGVRLRDSFPAGTLGRSQRGMSTEPKREDLVKGTPEAIRMEAVKTGVIAGCFGSIVGVGGGVIMVPMMTCEPMCLQARHAAATSLVAVVGTGLVSALLYGMQGQVDFVGACLCTAAAVVTAPAGARATMVIDNKRLKLLMGLFLLVVAPAVPLKDHLLKSAGDDAKPPSPAEGGAGEAGEAGAARGEAGETHDGVLGALWARVKGAPGFMALPSDTDRAKYAAACVSTGGLAGFLSGLLGIGGGMVVTPVLALCSGMGQTAVVGTSMVAMVLPSLMSLYTHHTLGNVRWRVGKMLLVGSATGAFMGVNLANTAGDSGMKYIFAAGMFFLGSKTVRASLS